MSLYAPTLDKDDRYATAQRVSLLFYSSSERVLAGEHRGAGWPLERNGMNSSKGWTAHIKSLGIALCSACVRRAGCVAAFEAAGFT